MTVLCVPVLCCVPAVCLSSCENRPQHRAQEPQTHQKFESLKIINSRDDEIRFEFDELYTKGSPQSFEFISGRMVTPWMDRDRF